jgi:hypothetical protein
MPSLIMTKPIGWSSRYTARYQAFASGYSSASCMDWVTLPT